MQGDPSTREEFEAHMVRHTGCTAIVDADSGDIVPLSLCRTGEALQYAASWDADRAHLKHMREDRI